MNEFQEKQREEKKYKEMSQQTQIQQQQNMSLQKPEMDAAQARTLCRQKVQEFARRSENKKKNVEVLKNELSKLEKELRTLQENANQYEVDQLNKEVRILSKRYVLMQNEVKLQQEQAQEWEDAQNALAAKWKFTNDPQIEQNDAQSVSESAQERIEEIKNEVDMEESVNSIKKQYEESAKQKTEASEKLEQYVSRMEEFQTAYKNRRGYFDSDYFKKIGPALDKYLSLYRTKGNERECMVAEKALQEAANAYLQHAARSRQNEERNKRQLFLKDMLAAVEQKNEAIRILQGGDNAAISSEKQHYQEYLEKNQESEKKRQLREQQEQEDREYVQQELQREYQEEEKKETTTSEQIRKALLDAFQSKDFDFTRNIDMDLYLKEGTLYDKKSGKGILSQIIEHDSESKWFHVDNGDYIEEISVDEEGNVHAVMGKGGEITFVLFNNETNISMGNDSLGMDVQVITNLLAVKYGVSAQVGSLGEEGFGVGAFLEAGVNVASMELSTDIKVMGMRLSLALGLSVGLGVFGQVILTDKNAKLEAEISSVLGAYFGISLEYGDGITPELAQIYIDSYRQNLKAGEAELRKIREEQDIDEQYMLENATEEDKAWWNAAARMDYECMCGMEVLRRELRKGEEADQEKMKGVLLIIRQRLLDKYNNCTEQLKNDNLKDEQKEYFIKESNYISKQYAILMDADILDNLKNGESIQKLNELEGNTAIPEDIHINMTGVMEAVRNKMESIENLSLNSKEMLKWQNNQMSIKTEKEAEAIKDAICENAIQLPDYEEYKFIHDWNMRPTQEELDKKYESIKAQITDLEQYVQDTVDKYSQNVEEELNSLYALSADPVEMILKIDRLRHQYRHTDVYTDKEQSEKFRLAEELMKTCAELNMTMDNLEKCTAGYTRELQEKREEERKKQEEITAQKKQRAEALSDEERSGLIHDLQIMGNENIAQILHVLEDIRLNNNGEEQQQERKDLCKKLIFNIQSKASALNLGSSLKRLTSLNVHDSEFLSRQVDAYGRVVEILQEDKKRGITEHTVHRIADYLSGVPTMPVQISVETSGMNKQMLNAIHDVTHKDNGDYLLNRSSYKLLRQYVTGSSIDLKDEKKCDELSGMMSKFYAEMSDMEEFQDGWFSDGKAAVLLKQIEKQADAAVEKEQNSYVEPLKSAEVQTVFEMYGRQIGQRNHVITGSFLRPEVTQRLIRLQHLVAVYNELPKQQFNDSFSSMEGERYIQAKEIRAVSTWLTAYMDTVMQQRREIENASLTNNNQ